MKILIIKTGALGDVVRTSFIAQALKEKYGVKDLELFWLTDTKAKAFFINNPYVDYAIEIQNTRAISDLLKIQFDLVINLEEGIEECKLVSSLKTKKIIGVFLDDKGKIKYSSDSAYWFDMSMISKYGKKKADDLKKKNKKTYRQIMLEIIEIKNYQKYESFLRLTSNQRTYAKEFLRRHSLSKKDLIIGMNTGSADRWPKQLSIKKTLGLIERLCKEFNAKIFLFGGPNEIKRNMEIIAKSKVPIIDTGTGSNLVEFPALISLCNLFITSDTLGLHLGLALKRKTICLIGPTSSSEIDMYGLGEKIVSKSKCICCYRKDCKSMEKIDINDVTKKAKSLLKQKITLLIMAFNEPNIQKAVESALNQKTRYDYEVLVSIPDIKTQKIVEKYVKKDKLRLIKDSGKGKSFALNEAISNLKTDILILTDGDVYISENCVEDIVNAFFDPEVGCLSGRPVPQESKNNKYGYWANFLFDAAHRIRKKAAQTDSFLECSGYLFAFRKEFIKNIPLNVAEDTVIPYFFWKKGYKIDYVETGKVYVRNARNIRDWVKQKLRTHKSHGDLGRYVDVITTPKVKSFRTESKGIFWLLSYPSNLVEMVWAMELALARLYTWGMFFLHTHIIDRRYQDAWERVESTK